MDTLNNPSITDISFHYMDDDYDFRKIIERHNKLKSLDIENIKDFSEEEVKNIHFSKNLEKIKLVISNDNLLIQLFSYFLKLKKNLFL